ncbi:11655_t:CDS:2, partial [Paraglomus brasilianum]
GQSQLLNEDIIRQIKEVHDAVIISKPETVSLSSFNTTNWRAFFRKTGISIEWLDNELPNEATDIETYTWSYPENHETQRQNYISYLQKHLHPLPRIFNLSGGTDIPGISFWLNEKKIMGIEFTHRKSAMQFIHSMVLENEWTTGKRYLPLLEHRTVKRMKFNSMLEIEGEAVPDDIANMEDFYEEMTEEDIRKHKIGKA